MSTQFTSTSGVPVLEVTNLVKHFSVSGSKGLRKTRATVHAVSDVSFTVNEGQTVEFEEVANRGKTSAENLKV